VAGLTLLSLAACGAPSAASSAASGGSEGKTSIKVVVAPIQFETAYVAKEKGFFDAAGLTVEIVPGADPAANLAQTVSGQADITTASWGVMTTATAKGMPVKVISGNGVVDPNVDNSGILIPKNSGIKTVADLKGKNVAVVGVNTGGDIPMLQAAAAAGIDPKSITEIAVPYAGMQAALEQGTVDAAFAADTFYHQLVDAGFKSIASPVREFQGNMPVTVWAATDAWLKSNPGTAKKFNDAMTKAAAFYTDPANVKAIVDITARIKQVDASKVNPKAYVPVNVSINLATGQAGIDAMKDLGFVTKPLTAEAMLWADAPRFAK
ncbi:ABC transporter substrate-binding protein, partial [Arthrobacter sp. 2YAF22_2]|uniref:ABC transporter substrate-binding protein n=1 Tax=Arthrobacter sp. 2YAF22_2 TaxID=3233029 RepID=UPI003F933BF1